MWTCFAQGYVKKALNAIALVQVGRRDAHTETHRRPTLKKVAIVAKMPHLIFRLTFFYSLSQLPQDNHAEMQMSCLLKGETHNTAA